MKTSLYKIGVCSLFLSLSAIVTAQTDWKLYPGKTTNSEYSNNTYGQIDIIVDSRISALSERFSKENKANNTLDGYRVQIFFGDRNQANAIKTEFLKKHSDIDTYLTYLAPNFRVRIGNFRSKLDADRFLHSLKKDFPTAYVVKESIELPKL